MYKSICLLVAVLAVSALIPMNKSADASATTNFPVIVAKAKLVNQTGDMPALTIFKPSVTGLYRLSIYFTSV